MVIYIAAPWARKIEAREMRDTLVNIFGLKVSSHWLDSPDGQGYEASSEEMKLEAERDREEVWNCDVLLFLNLEMSEGKATELGMALMLGKSIYCIGGKQRNVFLHLPQVTHVDSVESFAAAVAATL